MRLCPTVTIAIHDICLDELPKQTIDSRISRDGYRWIACTIYVAGSGHRQTSRTIYCVDQWPSMDAVHHPLCSTMSISIDNVTSLLMPTIRYIYLPQSIVAANNIHRIDRFPPSSIVEAIDHICVHCPECGEQCVERLLRSHFVVIWYTVTLLLYVRTYVRTCRIDFEFPVW